MSSRKYAAQLNLEPGRSLWLGVLLLLAHGGSLGVLFLVPLPVYAAWAAALIVLASMAWGIRRHALRLDRNAIVRLVWDADDAWLLVTAAGRELAAVLMTSSYVHPWLAVLNFQTEGTGVRRLWRRRSVVLLPDALDAESFRRLRVRLRIDGAATP